MDEKDIERMRRNAPENFFRDGEFATVEEAYAYWRRRARGAVGRDG